MTDLKKTQTMLLVLGMTIVFCCLGEVAGKEIAGKKIKRIIGGTESSVGAWPWMAALASPRGESLKTSQYCGATLIHPRWAITAAHCVYDDRAEDLEIALGVHNLENDDGDRYAVKRKILHPNYSWDTDDNDVALLELEREASWATLALYTGGDSLESQNALTMGWGSTHPIAEIYSDNLLEVEVSIVSNEACNDAYENERGYGDDPITDAMLCAGATGKDSCTGDSGGPLIVLDGEIWKQAGVVSWGGGRCAQNNLYGVYTRISEMAAFIEEHVGAPAGREKLFFPHVRTAGEWKTDVEILNTGAGGVAGSLRAYASSGRDLGSVELNIPSFGRKRVAVNEVFPNSQAVAYMAFEYGSDNSAIVSGHAELRIDGRHRAAVRAATETGKDVLFAPSVIAAGAWRTQICLANTSLFSKTPEIEFDIGVKRTIDVEPGAQVAIDVSELLGDEAENTKSAVIRNATGIVGIVLLGEESENKNSLAGYLLNDETSARLALANIAEDANWSTRIAIQNPHDSQCAITIRPFDADGTAVSIAVGGNGADTFSVSELGLGGNIAWFEIEASLPISGLALIGTRNGRQFAACPITDAGRTGMIRGIETGWTGMALANPGERPAETVLTAYDGNGGRIASETLVIGARSRMAGMPKHIFSEDIGGAAVIVYSSESEIAGYRMNGSPDGEMLDALGTNQEFSEN